MSSNNKNFEESLEQNNKSKDNTLSTNNISNPSISNVNGLGGSIKSLNSPLPISENVNLQQAEESIVLASQKSNSTSKPQTGTNKSTQYSRKSIKPPHQKDSLKNLLYNNSKSTSFSSYLSDTEKKQPIYPNLVRGFNSQYNNANFSPKANINDPNLALKSLSSLSPISPVPNKLPLAPRGSIPQNILQSQVKFSSPLNPDKKNKRELLKSGEISDGSLKQIRRYSRNGKSVSTPLSTSSTPIPSSIGLSSTSTLGPPYKQIKTKEEIEHNAKVIEKISIALEKDKIAVINPEYKNSFKDFNDVLERLLPYHIYQYDEKSIKPTYNSILLDKKEANISQRYKIVSDKIENYKRKINEENYETKHLNIIIDKFLLNNDIPFQGFNINNRITTASPSNASSNQRATPDN